MCSICSSKNSILIETDEYHLCLLCKDNFEAKIGEDYFNSAKRTQTLHELALDHKIKTGKVEPCYICGSISYHKQSPRKLGCPTVIQIMNRYFCSNHTNYEVLDKLFNLLEPPEDIACGSDITPTVSCGMEAITNLNRYDHDNMYLYTFKDNDSQGYLQKQLILCNTCYFLQEYNLRHKIDDLFKV